MRPVTIPVDIEDLSPAWFTAALDVDVTAAEILDAHSGTTGRARVALEGAGVPDSVFVKLAPFDADQRAFVRMTGLGLAETRFYATAGNALPVRSPRVLRADSDEDGNFVMVLEDLVASGCRFPERAEADEDERARSTVEELARLHATFWESARFDGDLAWLPDHGGFGDMDAATAAAASGAYVRQAFEPFVDEMPTAFREVGELYAERTREILDLWSEGERTLIHGDCHIGNLFVDGGRTGFYDWALLSRAPGVRDVAYTCCYSMSRDARRALEHDLLDHYLATLHSEGVRLDPAVAWDQYRRFAVFAWVSATTTAAMGTKWQREELSRAAMERTTAAVEDLDSVEALRASLD